MTVPGIPNAVENIPANNTKMKTVNPTVSRGVKAYFLFFNVDGL